MSPPPYTLRLSAADRQLLLDAAKRLYPGRAQPLGGFIRYAACCFARDVLQKDDGRTELLERVPVEQLAFFVTRTVDTRGAAAAAVILEDPAPAKKAKRKRKGRS